MDTKKFCENCREDVDYYIKDEILKTMYDLTYPGQVAYCKECNNEIYHQDISDINITAGHNVIKKYRKENNMLITNNRDDTEVLMVKCECGCKGLEITAFDWEDGNKDYSISMFANSFSEEQKGIFSELINRIKLAFLMLRGKKYRFNEICLTEEMFNEFKEKINEL